MRLRQLNSGRIRKEESTDSSHMSIWRFGHESIYALFLYDVIMGVGGNKALILRLK